MNSQSYGTGHQLISPGVNNRQQNANFPLMNFEYEMGHNNNNQMCQSQSHYQYHLGEQHMKGFNYPLVQMDGNFVQHLGQLNAQFISQHGMFPNVNYAGDNFMMNPNTSMNINPNNMNMNRAIITAKRV